MATAKHPGWHNSSMPLCNTSCVRMLSDNNPERSNLLNTSPLCLKQAMAYCMSFLCHLCCAKHVRTMQHCA
jgi:hypothetical protein